MSITIRKKHKYCFQVISSVCSLWIYVRLRSYIYLTLKVDSMMHAFVYLLCAECMCQLNFQFLNSFPPHFNFFKSHTQLHKFHKCTICVYLLLQRDCLFWVKALLPTWLVIVLKAYFYCKRKLKCKLMCYKFSSVMQLPLLHW